MPSILLYISFVTGIGLLNLYRFFPLFTTLFILAASAVLILQHQRRVLICLLILLAAFSYASVRHGAGHDSAPLSLRSQPFSAVISGLPVATSHGYLQEIRLLRPETNQKTLMRTNTPFAPGSSLKGYGALRLREARVTPGDHGRKPVIFLNPAGSMEVHQDGSLRWIPQRMRWTLHNFFKRNFSPDVSGLLSAIVIGHRESSSNAIYAAYTKIGLAHLMSISGTHFGLFTLILFTLIRLSARILPYRWLVRLTSRLSLDEVAAIITLPLILAYLFLSGGRIPAVRSFLMINIVLLGLLLGRKGEWLNSLLFAATVILLIDPSSMESISFQLSFLAVLSIGFSIEFLENHIDTDRIHKVLLLPLRLSAATIGALTGTSPLVIYYFHTISSLSLPANLAFTPFVCFIILPLALSGGIIFLVTGYFPFISVIQAVGEVTNSAALRLSAYDYASLHLRTFPVIALFIIYPLFFLLLKGKRPVILLSLAGISLALILYFSYPSTDGSVTFLDVGQGEASVIESSDGKVMAVDTGRTGREMINYLKYRGHKGLDVLILSHGAADHTGGLWNILKTVNVRELWDNGLITYSPSIGGKIIHRGLTAGSILEGGNTSFIALHPYEGYYSLKGSDENNHSLVLKYQDGPLSVLFTGDIESDAEDFMLHLKDHLRSDLLKVAHHGSYTSSTPGFLNAVNPSTAVISAGKANSYGHPHKSTVDALSQFRLLRTDIDGSVRVSTGNEGEIVLSRYRDYKLKELQRYNIDDEVRNMKNLFLVW